MARCLFAGRARLTARGGATAASRRAPPGALSDVLPPRRRTVDAARADPEALVLRRHGQLELLCAQTKKRQR